MNSDRREFLTGAALLAGAASLGGCASAFKVTSGGSMNGYVAPKLDRIRVGVVGVGDRGNYAAHRLSSVPGVEVTAVCDLVASKVERTIKWFKDQGFNAPKGFVGPEGYKRLCDSGLCDVVHNNTDWSGHVPVCVYAMRAGLHTCVEVPGCRTVDEAWELVETSEATSRHCMMLENCCYGEHEMLLLNLAQKGKLGKIMHGEGGYIHDGRCNVVDDRKRDLPWRLKARKNTTGMSYPTHGLGPIAMAMNINRGDRFDYLVSTGSEGFGFQDYARRKYGADTKTANTKFEYNDVSNVLIRTALGKTIFLQQYGSGPHPYSRMNKLVGTDGAAGTYPLRVALEKTLGAEAKDWMPKAELEAFRKQWMHPLWKTAGEIAKKAGGHGGMDFLMDLRWTYCLQQGLPVDMSVYDLASWSCIVELSCESVRNRSKTMDFPDFTRGTWKTVAPFGDMAIDPEKLKINRGNLNKIGRQQTV